MADTSQARVKRNVRTTELQGWTIETTKEPILSAGDADSLANELDIPLPEICFGNNALTVSNGQIAFEWTTVDALRAVKHSVDLRVAHADAWQKGQSSSSSSGSSGMPYKVQKPFDWTYTSLSHGKESTRGSMSERQFEKAPATHPGIPMHLLARTDIPIVFFEEVPLFEDELGDNGISEVIVRIRANSSSWFVLSRFFLRVDKVLFRLYDVRTYHAFGSDEVIRDIKGRQATYEQVKRFLPAGSDEDLTKLTDVNWVASVLERIASSPPNKESEEEWEGSGHRLQVLKL